MRKHSDLEGCAVHCCQCEIRFFTHPRNAGRLDLRCPFGCREHHRRQLANERSKKHYGTDEGRRNKKRLNSKRSKVANSPPQDDASSPCEQQPPQPAPKEEPRKDVVLPLDGFVLDERALVNSRILPYVRMVASLIEGRTISREELLAALRKSMRQRSIDRLPRREYVLRYLNQHPP